MLFAACLSFVSLLSLSPSLSLIHNESPSPLLSFSLSLFIITFNSFNQFIQLTITIYFIALVFIYWFGLKLKKKVIIKTNYSHYKRNNMYVRIFKQKRFSQ